MKLIGNSQRIVSPSATLKRFANKAKMCGITRIGDISCLDITCLPVATAIRPMAKTLQVSNGKGLTIESAKVSAMMEGIEIYHAESSKGLETHKQSQDKYEDNSNYYMQENNSWRRINSEWLNGKHYYYGKIKRVFVSEIDVLMYNTVNLNTSNGLASGNCYEEAVVHGLYELIERDAIVNNQKSEVHKFMDLTTVQNREIKQYIKQIEDSGSEIFCRRLMHRSGLYIYETTIVNMSMPNQLTAIVKGYGCHQMMSIALLRALTEAIQSRTTAIHATREDVVKLKKLYVRHPTLDENLMNTIQKIRKIKKVAFDNKEVEISHDKNIKQIMEELIYTINKTMKRPCLTIELTREGIGVPVVKCIIPDINGITNLEDMRWNSN